MSGWEDEPEQVEVTGGASNDYGSGDGDVPSRGGHGTRANYRGRGRGGFRGDSDCKKCDEQGHTAWDCPSDSGGRKNRGCFKCGEESHMSRDCPTGGGGGSGSRGCYNCGEEGHMVRDCPSEAGSGRRSERPQGCFNCGEKGHNKADCTNPAKAREEELGPDGKPRPPLYVPEHIKDEQLFSEGVNVGINFDAYESIPVSVSGSGEVPLPLGSFEESGLRELLIDNIRKAGYTRPTPIQRHCIPTIMAGRDLMGCAQTGSGKTAAFLLPILHSILASGGGGGSGMTSVAEPNALVVAPTRELAIQIHNEARKFALNSILRTVVCYGGASVGSQYRQLQNGCSVLVATPGRLIDFLDRGRLSFAHVTHVVLDEADRMLDMGFVGDVEKIMNHSSMPSLCDRQTLLFSATFPEEIQSLAAKYLNDYVFYVVGVVGAANTDVHQEVLNVPRFQKRELLVSQLSEILSANAKSKILVFVETKRTADFLASYLSTQQLNSTSIHGDRFQSQREEALHQFKSGLRSILVATAVAARGLDIRGVTHVINYDLPKEVDEYVHRIGRTGRVGNKGQAISFYDDEQDGPIAKNLVKILSDAEQEVPGWLKDAAQLSGHSQTYYGVGDFASSDIRGNDMYEESSQAFGGPAVEENWG